MSEGLDGTISIGLAAAVVFTAAAHGAVETWSRLAFEGIVFGLALLWTVKMFRDKRFRVAIPGVALPLSALILVCAAQSIRVTDSGGNSHSLSMDVHATRSTLLMLLTLLVALLLGATFLEGRRTLTVWAGFLAIFGLAMAVFALVQNFTWNGHFYWVGPTPESVVGTDASPFGSFANRNHFAGYMELLVPVPAALVVTGGVRGEARLFFGFAAIMMGVSTVASLSRGGLLSLAGAIVFIAVLSFVVPRTRSARVKPQGPAGRSHLWTRIGVVAGIATAIALGTVWIGSRAVTDRLSETFADITGSDPQADFTTHRRWIWRNTVSMIREHPIAGVGMGAYAKAYPAYSQNDAARVFSYAHNDYLQLLADCGAVGGVIAVWFLISVFSSLRRALKARDPFLAGLAIGAGASILALLIHSLVDYNLQIPSTALLFLLLAGIASNLGESSSAGTQTSRVRLSQQEYSYERGNN